jgi:N-acetylated-alpha-linked acidic dipeptidase
MGAHLEALKSRQHKVSLAPSKLILKEFGAVGVIIYSDPQQDGHLKDGKPYPNGPARHPSAVQRGSVQFLSKLPGDPSTPGYASKPGVNRSDPHEYIPSIPSLPISYRDATPFLKALNGGKLCRAKSADNWAGSLEGVEYCAQSNKKPTVTLVNNVEYVYTPIQNVIGRIPGRSQQEVILGNHRDAWVYGAGDPISGSASFNAIAQAFGHLLSKGWKPYRTIILASWDAEEYGLVGSTEWVEDHTKHLTKNTIAYLNSDIGAVGDALNIAASPLLNDVLLQATKDVVTNTGDTVYDNWKNTSNGPPQIGVLGSGSDYTGFLQLLGITSADLGFGARKAVYQCISVIHKPNPRSFELR